MSIAKQYIEGLKNAYIENGFLEEWTVFEHVVCGAAEEDVKKIKSVYPECPDSLIEILKFVDGTYHRQYGDKYVLFYFLGSDVYEYPYYLLSAKQIYDDQNVGTDYDDYIAREYEEVEIDDRITSKTDGVKWLHFSDCMNNGGTSQLFIDFSPSEKGTKGQLIRFLHDPDEFEVIADNFDEYLKKIIEHEYNFVVHALPGSESVSTEEL